MASREATIDASIMERPSIRQALLWRFVVRIALTFLVFCVAVYFLVLRPAATQIGRSEMERAAEQSETQIASVVSQIERIALTGRDWGLQNQFNLSDIHAFNRLFMALLSNQSQITSMLFANDRGQEFMLLKLPHGEWHNRITDTQKWGKMQRWLKWRGADDLISEEWTERDYDPLLRPWHIGAMSLTRERSIHWTKPYVFFTTKDPGITASVKWRDTELSENRILAFDVKLNDLSSLTMNLKVGNRGRSAILTDDGLLIGIPKYAGEKQISDIAGNILRKPSAADFSLLAIAWSQWEQHNRPFDQIRTLRSGNEDWLWRFHSTRVGSGQFITATLAPDTDFLPSALKQAAGAFGAIFLAVLVLGIFITARMARRFSAPMQKLAAESSRLGELDLEKPIEVEAPWRELGQLALAQERMRIALKASTAAIEQSNRDLEARVAQRTRELAEREAYFRAIFENTGVGILSRGPDRRVLQANNAYLDFLGCTREELEQTDPATFIVDEEFESIKRLLDRLAAGEIPMYRVERHYRRKDGGFRWADVVTSPIRDTDGRFLATVAIVNDITLRKEAEALLQAILDRVPLPIFYDGAGTEFLGCNPAYEKAFGIRRENFIGKPTNQQTFLPQSERDDYYRENMQVIQDGTTVRNEARMPFADGKVHNVIYSVSGFRKPDGSPGGLVGVLVDVSELRQTEEALRRAKEDAEEATRAKSMFLANMSHEIRTPMNGVIGMLEVLTHSNLSDGQADAVRTIRDSAFSLLGIIDDILDFSKIEAGRLELERTPVSVTDMVEDICTSLFQMAANKGVDLSGFVDPQLPPQIWSDSTRLRQVFYNLMGNAIKFSSGRTDRRGRVRISVELGHLAPPQLICTVADNGIGMAPETVETLFTSFTQAEASTTRRFGGTGLGLAICKRLVNLMQGDIQVNSAPGFGSTFTVTIPLQAVAGSVEEARVDLHGLCCIVIINPDINANDLRIYLEFSGAIVYLVPDLNAAVQRAEGQITTVVIIHDAKSRNVSMNTMRTAFAAIPNIRHLIIRGGRRQRARVEAPDLVTMDGNALRRRNLLRAVAVAGGLASPEVFYERREGTGTAENITVPSIAEARTQNRLILVAEDDEINQKVILRQLALLGYAAEIVPNGLEALRMWRSGGYALLLTDLHMPEMDGYLLAEAIRREEEDTSRMPILALTANALAGEAARALAAGMNEYLTKPLQLNLLRSALEKWMPDSTESTTQGSTAESTATSDNGKHVAVDVSVLKSLVGDDPQTLHELLGDYQDSVQRLAKELREGVAGDDTRQVVTASHKLKSASRSVGALQLGDLCAELENAGKTGDKAAIKLAMVTFEATLIEVETEITYMLKEH